jgi:subtilase family serine protease
VTVKNQSTADYQGPLVVSAVGLPEGDLQEAFIVNIKAGGTQTVEFDLPTANTDGGTVAISVDVGDNIEESNEDNNDATFLVAAAVDAPELTVAAVVNGPQINVTVTNVGGRLDTASVYVSVSLGVTNSSATKSITLETGQSEQFVVSTPPSSGVAQVTVFANGEAIGSGSVQVGDPATATPEPTTES